LIDFETGRVTRFDIEKEAEEEGELPLWKRIINVII
jgi:lysine-specific permease